MNFYLLQIPRIHVTYTPFMKSKKWVKFLCEALFLNLLAANEDVSYNAALLALACFDGISFPRKKSGKEKENDESRRLFLLDLQRFTNALETIHRWCRQFFQIFNTPLPRVGSFLLYTIRRQFGPIFDPSPPPNCRRRLWTAPCRILVWESREQSTVLSLTGVKI